MLTVETRLTEAAGDARRLEQVGATVIEAMARLFGFLGNRTDLGGSVVQRYRDLLRWQRSADEAVGWGVGFYQSGEVLLRRRPYDDRELVDPVQAVEGVRTDLLMAHVRKPGVGSLRTENTQPFRYRSWLFAQTGCLPPVDEVRRAIHAELPEFLRRNIRGDTDGELMFYLLLARLQEAGHLSDLGVSSAAVGLALRETVGILDRAVGGVTGESVAINALVSNGESFVALCRGAPMALRRIEGTDAAEDLVGDVGSYRPRVPNLDATRITLVISDHREAMPEGFTAVEPNSLVSLSRDAAPHIESLS